MTQEAGNARERPKTFAPRLGGGQDRALGPDEP